MASFPKLKTNAIAQYPATKAVCFQNEVLRFLDGSDQRYRDCPGARRRWGIRLEVLDEGEMAAIEDFFVTNEGRSENFEFTDPWDGRVYPNCSFAADQLELTSIGEMNGRASLTVVQNRV